MRSYLVNDLLFDSLKVVRPPSKGNEVLPKRVLAESLKYLEDFLYSEIEYDFDTYLISLTKILITCSIIYNTIINATTNGKLSNTHIFNLLIVFKCIEKAHYSRYDLN